jgi:uncharacterized protein (DUF2141 family)
LATFGASLGILTHRDMTNLRKFQSTSTKMDKNLVGLPKEGYGFSNDPGRKMRPAKFEEARFRAESNQSVDVKLAY